MKTSTQRYPRHIRRLLAGLLAAPLAVAAADCPDLAGHYRVAGFGPVLGDALEALQLPMAGFRDSEVRIEGDAGVALAFFVSSGRGGTPASTPARVLHAGIDYDCADGVLTLRDAARATRKVDDAFLEGESTVSLSRSGAGLALATDFGGGERSTLYSYDSARISVPKLGSGRRLREQIRWPGHDEPRPQPPPGPAAEPLRVAELRRKLDPLLAGAVRLGGLQADGERVRASLGLSRTEDAVAFEDRLHAAGLAYAVTRAPIWSNNQYYMEIVFDGSTPESGWHPSEFRVAQELERLRHPMVSVRAVHDEGDHYMAELDVIGDEPAERILQRLRANSTMFAAIEVVDDSAQPDRRNLRLLRLRLRID